MSLSTSTTTSTTLEKPHPLRNMKLVEIPSILSESITTFGGFGALLLQIAHPGVARGVHNHSAFATRQLDRAEKTAIYVYMTVFGTPEEKRLIAKWVNKMHTRVKGGEGDEAYRANDPDLQLWVAATLYVGWVKSYENCFGELTGERAERVYREFSVFGTALNVPPAKWPETRERFWEYYHSVVQNDLRLVDEGSEVWYHIQNPKLPWAHALFSPWLRYLMRILSVDYLPAEVRQMYGLRETTTFQKWYKSFFFWQYRLTPTFLRSWPKRYYMARGRVMVQRLKETGFGGEGKMKQG